MRSRHALRSSASALAFALLTLASLRAHAAEPTAEDRAQATRLFAQGTQLLADSRAPEACPKFEEAERLAPGFGIELNLGDCYEKTGRLASAWAMFQKAAANARADGKHDREANVTARAKAIEPRLSYLSIDVPASSRVAGLTVTRDGRELGAGQWAEALPVDAGTHVVAASAPGRVAWTVPIAVEEAARVVREVPVLAMAPPSSPASGVVEAAPAAARGASWQRPAGFVALGVGAAGVITGAVLVLVAKGKHDDANPHCPTATSCDSEGVSLRGSAVDFANGATAAFVVGGVGLAAGAALLWLVPALAPSPTRGGLVVGPAVGSSGLDARYAF